MEDYVRARALAGLHDAIPHLAEIARTAGARDAPIAARELRAIAMPDRSQQPQAPPESAGADVARILEAAGRLMRSLPGRDVQQIAVITADYNLLEPPSPDSEAEGMSKE